MIDGDVLGYHNGVIDETDLEVPEKVSKYKSNKIIR